MRNLYLMIIGFVTGFASAALGIGGGAILVSSLIIFLGCKIKKVIGTSLAAMVLTVLAGILTHYFMNKANIKFLDALFIIMGSLPGAYLGAELVNAIPADRLKKFFAIFLIIAGLKMLGALNMPVQEISNVSFKLFLIALGLVSGTLSAFFGIGGGLITVPGLNLFFGLSMHEAIATSLVVILPTALAGAMFHKKFNNIQIDILKFIIPAALIGSVLGAITANNLPQTVLKNAFGIFVLFCAARIIFQKDKS